MVSRRYFRRSRLYLALGVPLAAGVLGFSSFGNGPTNFVSVFRDSGCVDLVPPGSVWSPHGPAKNDAKEEAAAGRAATGYGTFVGVSPEGGRRCAPVWQP
jgi:hypothetical protein